MAVAICCTMMWRSSTLFTMVVSSLPAFCDRSTPRSTLVLTCSIEETALLTLFWISLIMPLTSEVAPVVLSASFLTSSATTANPLPCSPARAASMAAFSARRFV